jgi:hypothetical protein
MRVLRVVSGFLLVLCAAPHRAVGQEDSLAMAAGGFQFHFPRQSAQKPAAMTASDANASPPPSGGVVPQAFITDLFPDETGRATLSETELGAKSLALMMLDGTEKAISSNPRLGSIAEKYVPMFMEKLRFAKLRLPAADFSFVATGPSKMEAYYDPRDRTLGLKMEDVIAQPLSRTAEDMLHEVEHAAQYERFGRMGHFGEERDATRFQVIVALLGGFNPGGNAYVFDSRFDVKLPQMIEELAPGLPSDLPRIAAGTRIHFDSRLLHILAGLPARGENFWFKPCHTGRELVDITLRQGAAQEPGNDIEIADRTDTENGGAGFKVIRLRLKSPLIDSVTFGFPKNMPLQRRHLENMLNSTIRFVGQ